MIPLDVPRRLMGDARMETVHSASHPHRSPALEIHKRVAAVSRIHKGSPVEGRTVKGSTTKHHTGRQPTATPLYQRLHPKPTSDKQHEWSYPEQQATSTGFQIHA